MANKRKQKDQGFLGRCEAWVKANQKVIWVSLLILIAPSFAMTGIFTSSASYNPGKAVVNVIFGQHITKADYEAAAFQLGSVGSLVISGFVNTFTPLPGVLGSSEFSYPSDRQRDWRRMDLGEYFAYSAKALDLGIRVSDVELSGYIRELWRRAEAVRRATAQLQNEPASADPAVRSSLWSKRIQLTQTNLQELRGADGKYFDQASWARIIEGDRKGNWMRVKDFEEALRKVVLIAKLEAYVKDTVQVSPEEVFAKYNEDKQTRKVSWAEFAAPPELVEKVAATLTDDDVKTYYGENKKSFKKDTSIRVGWLLLPEDHFKAEATKRVTEETIKEYFDDHRNDYRRAAISSSEALFSLHTAEEREAANKERYKGLDEVKDDVREKVIEEQTATDIRASSETLALRLYPEDTAVTAATFQELVAEFPFLETGKTEYVTEDEAEGAFGRGYGPRVTRWFAALRYDEPLAPARRAVLGHEGYVFYSEVETRPGNYFPLLSEIEAEVRESLTSRNVARLLEEALTAVSEEINDGSKTFEAVLAAGLDVEVEGETVHLSASPVEASKTFIGKNGPLMVVKAKESASEDEESSEDGDDEADDEDDVEPEEEPHAASEPILAAAFAIDDGDLGQSSVATEESVAACYLVRFDALRLPNPAGFEKAEPTIEAALLREDQRLYFAKWRIDLMKEALPPRRGLPEESEAAEESEPDAAEEPSAAEESEPDAAEEPSAAEESEPDAAEEPSAAEE